MTWAYVGCLGPPWFAPEYQGECFREFALVHWQVRCGLAVQLARGGLRHVSGLLSICYRKKARRQSANGVIGNRYRNRLAGEMVRGENPSSTLSRRK